MATATTRSPGLDWARQSESLGTVKAKGGRNGSADDTGVINAMFAAGKPVFLNGDTALISGALTSSVPVVVHGPGTLKFSSSQQFGWAATSDITLHDVALDGDNSGVQFLINQSAGNFRMRGGSVKNVYATGADGAAGLRLYGTGSDIERVVFQSLCSPADTTVGNSPGSINALALAAGVHRVQSCSFVDINNRATAGGTKQYEDADVITIYNATTSVTVDDCYFEDMGKRCVKQAASGCYLRFSNNRILSSYTGTTDDAGTDGNGIYAIVDQFGGIVDVIDNTLLGGVVGYFLGISGAATVRARFQGNSGAAEYHRYVNGDGTAAVWLATGVNADFDFESSDNMLGGFYWGETFSSKIRVLSHNRNTYRTKRIGLEPGYGATRVVASGNTYIQQADTTADSGDPGIRISDSTDSFTLTGNHAILKYNVVKINAQTGVFRGTVRDSSGQSLVSTAISNTHGVDSDLLLDNNVVVT